MARLATLLKTREKAIDAALEAAKDHFSVIGTHLRAIRDDELYKLEYETFEAYVLARWDFTRQHAYRLISAATVLEDLSPRGDKPDDAELPRTEMQVREVGLSSSDPEVRREVWETAQEIGETEQPSAPVIRKAAELVTTGKPVNHESAEIDAAIESFAKTLAKLIKSGQAIQQAFAAKFAVSQPMQHRKITWEKKIGNMAAQVDLVREHSEGLAESWNKTKKQVDE